MPLFADFVAGVFLCNCIPHLVAGLQGEPFPSPFATPHGVGDSRPLVNVLWGFSNLLLGAVLLKRFPVEFMPAPAFAAFFAGALVLACYVSWHFGRVKRARRARSGA